ncbi:MAG TPA: bifunctional phosphoglucose/phosphomannose isomerase [Candidatus Eremiobacteraceae bacterium]|nr:bifunctional phosphoglucose/phosphomannose isomerase [Candidatus Eremiobacteraceae bacterium]
MLDAIDLTKADPENMMGAILSLPDQCVRAREIASSAALEPLQGRVFANAVVAGMGGSAIGGDLLRSIFEDVLRMPVEVSRDYHLPEFVGADSLVIAASYSGNTEETLSAYAAARKARAALLAVTTGGELAARCAKDGVPAILIPGGLQPRAALGYSFVPLVVAAARLGLMPADLLADLDEMVAILERVRDECAPDVVQADNRAKQLAMQWRGCIPVIYGSQGERGVVAYRWKTQINENAKAFAASGVLPEIDHNEIVGWSGHDGPRRPAQERPERELAVVFLRDDREPDRIRRRAALTKTIVEKRAACVAEMWCSGESRLARAMSLVYLGDFASCYLAYAYGEDPTPVVVIDWLKSELAKAARP